MCQDTEHPLTFETVLSDPLIRLVMDSDGVSLRALIAILEAAREGRDAHRPPSARIRDVRKRGSATHAEA